MADKDDRKTDDGTAGPRPQGVAQGEVVEELQARADFLRKNNFRSEAETKMVDAPEQGKPKSSRVAETK